MHPEDCLAAADVGTVDEHVPIEAAGPQERRIERLGPVGRREHDHTGVAPEPVHLDEQRVECLLAFVVATDDARAAGLAERVEFVDEDDAGGLRGGLLEHVADPRRPDADEHLHEVAAGLARDRFGQERLAGAGRPDE